MLAINEQWIPRNKLTEARDRNRLGARRETVGDMRILQNSPGISPVTKPLVAPISPPLIPAMVRQIGQTTLQTRATFGNESLWHGTPIKEEKTLSGPDIEGEDVTGLFADWERVGWQWSRKANSLIAYLTSRGQTYLVRIPLKKVQAMFNRSHCEQTGERFGPYREQSLDGFFKKLGRKLKKAVKQVAKNTVKSITAPIRFVKNPKKFVKETANKIKRTVKGVGKTALKVASSPVFAGVMAGISAIPPLTAVGAAGLAAYAAANAIKPAFNLAEKGIDTVDALTRKKRGKIKSAINSLPSGPKGLMKAALKSTSDKSNLSKSAFRLAGGALKRFV